MFQPVGQVGRKFLDRLPNGCKGRGIDGIALLGIGGRRREELRDTIEVAINARLNLPLLLGQFRLGWRLWPGWGGT